MRLNICIIPMMFNYILFLEHRYHGSDRFARLFAVKKSMIAEFKNRLFTISLFNTAFDNN